MVEDVLAKPAFQKVTRLVPLEPLLNDLQASGIFQQPLPPAIRGSYLRTLPGSHPGDGFFAALIERTT